MISAPASGQGKTTVTAALARWHRRQGRVVRVFKTGPDFLDPGILERASGLPVYNLDLWMGDEDHVRGLLHAAASAADLILIEGVMGLFDGTASTAGLASRLGIPVLAVIDASGMAQTFAAVAHGLASFDRDMPFAGVVANRVGSPGHAQMLSEALPESLRLHAWLARDAATALPERHLGLVSADEVGDLDARLDTLADALCGLEPGRPAAVAFSAVPTPAHASAPAVTADLSNVRIGIARDAAFSFLYPANLDVLRALGASLHFFSPLNDTALPPVDALYLPGGYPELHLDALAGNRAMHAAIAAHHAAAKPIFGECGGLLYLLESLSDRDGRQATMLGLLPGHAALQTRLVNLGMHSLPLPEGELRGHTYHHSRTSGTGPAFTHSLSARHHGTPEAVYRDARLTASYVHAYFPSNPAAVAALFTPNARIPS